MEVITWKEPANQWPRRFTCCGCGSVLDVAAADVTLPGQRDGDRGWFRCPVDQELNHLTVEQTREASQWLSRRLAAGE